MDRGIKTGLRGRRPRKVFRYMGIPSDLDENGILFMDAHVINQMTERVIYEQAPMSENLHSRLHLPQDQ